MTNDRPDQSFPAPDPGYYPSKAEAMPPPETPPFPYDHVFKRKVLKMILAGQADPGYAHFIHVGSDPRLKTPLESLAQIIDRFFHDHPAERPSPDTLDILIGEKKMGPAERQQLETEWQTVWGTEVSDPSFVTDRIDDWARREQLQAATWRAGLFLDKGDIDKAEEVLAQIGISPFSPFPPSSGEEKEAWPTLDPKALYGVIGKIVTAKAPYSEADVVALLVSLLVSLGNAIGRGPYFQVEATRHYLNEFACLAGETAIARKGLALDVAKDIIYPFDPMWADKHIVSGLSTGEGLIYHVRDPSGPIDPEDEEGTVEQEWEDPGVTDKRLLVVEEEFSSPLKRSSNPTNTLNVIIRPAWDHGTLQTLIKHKSNRATNAHISILAHVTFQDLREHLTDTDKANGFGNRFLWFLVRQSKALDWDTTQRETPRNSLLVRSARQAVEKAKTIQRMTLDKEAKEFWNPLYKDRLSKAKPGLLGAITNRAAPHVMRLACLYAVLDKSDIVKRPHLEAALALWDYSEASVQIIFGERTGNPRVDRLYAALKVQKKMYDDQIHDLFGHNLSGRDIEWMKDKLILEGRATRDDAIKTGRRGRPRNALILRTI